DPLLALFALSAFYLYWRYKRTGRQSLIIFALLLYLAALLTKETAIALPVVVLYCELFYFTGGVPAGKRITRAFFLGAVFAVPTLIYLALRWYALNGLVASTGTEYPAVPAIKTLPLALAKYLSLSIIPYGYSYQHFTPAVNSIFSVRFLLPCLVVALVTAAVAISKSRTLVFAAIWFLVWLAPALFAIRRFESESLVQDRYLYLPTVGACVAIALGVRWCARRLRREGAPTTAAIALAAPVFLGIIAISAFAQAFVRQNAVWRDNLSLYANCAEMNPDSAHAHEALAGAYYAIGDKSAAQRELMTGFDIDSNDPRAYLLQSYFAQTDGSAERALYYLKRGAETIKPNPYTRYQLATLYLNLGFLYQRRSQADLAEASMQKSLEIWPRPVGWYYLGQFYLDQGRYEKAVWLFDETLKSTPPRFAPIHLKLARAYDGLGNSATAKQEYERYLQLDPQATDRAEVQKRLSQM
ncbi:MAG: tetratricopeptide repeat protein, partial [Blastocatellia bacterium]